MVLFSPDARRMLDAAVRFLPDAAQRGRWRDWAAVHREVRMPGGRLDDGTGPIPEPLAAIAFSALDRMEHRLIGERDGGRVLEDDLYVYDNDISLIHTIRQMLREDQGRRPCLKCSLNGSLFRPRGCYSR